MTNEIDRAVKLTKSIWECLILHLMMFKEIDELDGSLSCSFPEIATRGILADQHLVERLIKVP